MGGDTIPSVKADARIVVNPPPGVKVERDQRPYWIGNYILNTINDTILPIYHITSI